ncbi:MAG: ROK family protein, partial [Limnochordia bacterium]
GCKVQAIGVSTPGPLNFREGKIAYLHGATTWRDVPIKDLVHERFRVPTIIEHDANAAALAEYTFGELARKPGPDLRRRGPGHRRGRCPGR